MSDTVNLELEPWVHVGLDWCRNRSFRIITQKMLQKLTYPGDYRCVLPPIMSNEEQQRIIEAALEPTEGEYRVAKPYLGMVKMDSTLALRSMTKEQVKQNECLRKVMNDTIRNERKDCQARKDRYLAQQAERERAERDRFLRSQREIMDKEIKKQREKTIQPKNIKPLVKHELPAGPSKQLNDRLEPFIHHQKLCTERKEEFKQRVFQEWQSAVHWPGHKPPAGKLEKLEGKKKPKLVDRVKPPSVAKRDPTCTYYYRAQ